MKFPREKRGSHIKPHSFQCLRHDEENEVRQRNQKSCSGVDKTQKPRAGDVFLER
jgi:hypothetical protein